MASSFEIIVSRTGIGELTRITQFHKLEYVLVENDIGALTLVLPDTYSSTLFSTDTVLEVYRTLDGVTSLEGETVWFVRDTSITLNQAGEWLFTIVAFDAKELLKRRIVNGYAGSTISAKTDNADDIMRAIVREQLGPSAASDIAGIRYVIGVEADKGTNQAIAKAFAWRNVLAVLQDIANVLPAYSQRVAFHVVKSPGSLNDLEFRVHNARWGIDHSQDSGQPIVFSPDNGSLSDVQILFDAREEANVGYIGGEGEGQLRQLAQGYAPGSISRSYWNRREVFIDARNNSQATQLVSEAVAYISSRLARYRVSGKVQQTDDLEYGVEYRWGDEVVASAHGVSVDAIIKAVHVTADQNGESIDITLSSESLLFAQS